MVDPDKFHEGDSNDITQMKRIALTWDILAKYAPVLQAILERPYEDPDRLNAYERIQKKMMKEMDRRFRKATKKPIIRPIKKKNGHLIKNGRPGTPNTFIFHLGVEQKEFRPCARPGCRNKFIPSKLHRKYCSFGCEERTKRDRFIKKRREKNLATKSNNDTI